MFPGMFKNFSANGSNGSNWWKNFSNFSNFSGWNNSEYMRSYYEHAARSAQNASNLAWPSTHDFRNDAMAKTATRKAGRGRRASVTPNSQDGLTIISTTYISNKHLKQRTHLK